MTGKQRATDILKHETELRQQGFTLIAGMDEAGRGSWAGPLLAAALILPVGFDIEGIHDGKTLTPSQRENLHSRIVAEALAISVAWVTPAVIDAATEAEAFDACHVDLLRRTILALEPLPDFVLIDFLEVPGLPMDHRSIEHGDAVSATIAAASIIAKVTRDRMMTDLARRFPEYGFDRHKGYGGGQGEHAAALAEHGASPIHRLSSKGVRNAVGVGQGNRVP